MISAAPRELHSLSLFELFDQNDVCAVLFLTSANNALVFIFGVIFKCILFIN